MGLARTVGDRTDVLGILCRIGIYGTFFHKYNQNKLEYHKKKKIMNLPTAHNCEVLP